MKSFDVHPIDYINEVIEINLDPDSGSPYWNREIRKLGLDYREIKIEDLRDLKKFGYREESEIGNTYALDLKPKSIPNSEVFIGYSSGTTANPLRNKGGKKKIPWSKEFLDATTEYVAKELESWKVPKNKTWHAMGPPGIFERHLTDVAHKLDGIMFYTAVEPIYMKMLPKNMSSEEEHAIKNYKNVLGKIIDFQTRDIMNNYEPEVVMNLPPILKMWKESEDIKTDQVEATLFGGMGVSDEEVKVLKEYFPIFTGWYGNIVFGTAMWKIGNETPVYDTPKPLLYIDIVDPNDLKSVEINRKGIVLAHRFDKASFLPNIITKDIGIKRENGFKVIGRL